MYLSRFWLPAAAIAFTSLSVHAAATQAANDKRFLSAISIPSQWRCNSDVSNDGHLIYAVCDSKPAKEGMTPTEQAKLYIYDISDLHNPREVSQTSIGKVEGSRLVVRNGIAFYQEATGQGINIIDVRDPRHPKTAGHICTGSNLGFMVSNDGRFVINKAPQDDYTVIDVSDPNTPKKNAETTESKDIMVTPGKWTVYDSGRIAGIPGRLYIHDVRGKKILISSHQMSALLRLYDISVEGKPRLLASFLEDASTYEMHIIPGTQAVVFSQEGKNGDMLKLSLATTASFDLERLKQSYNLMAACRLRDTTYSRECSHLKFKGLADLKDAGIDKLLEETPAGLTEKQRVLMLNNYGFWLYGLYKEQENLPGLQEAASVLKKVAELAPDRAIAWLNLGDILYATIPYATINDHKGTVVLSGSGEDGSGCRQFKVARTGKHGNSGYMAFCKDGTVK